MVAGGHLHGVAQGTFGVRVESSEDSQAWRNILGSFQCEQMTTEG